MTYPFTIRRMAPSDREAVTALCLAADPHDWVPETLDYFVQEQAPEGLYLAETLERLIGCYHLGLVGEGEAFLSAMRVHPAVQGQGFGSLFCQAQVEQVRSAGVRSIYLHSQVDNARAHRTVMKNGFANLGEWAIYWGQTEAALEGAPRRARWASEADRPLIEHHRAGRDLTGTGRVISLPNDPWVMRTESEEDWAPARQVVVPGAEGLAGLMTLYSDADGLYIRRLEGSEEAARDLLEFAVAEWRRLGTGGLHVSLPKRGDELARPLGLKPDAAFRTFVFRHA